jgi:EpsI family protein
VERAGGARAARWLGSERVHFALLVALLAAGGALIWRVQLREPAAVDASALLSLPARIGAWEALGEVPLETSVEQMLRADFNLQRIYAHPLGESLALYVGYYGTERGGGPEHTPDQCYPSAGWRIVERRVVSADAEHGLRAHEFLVERDGERQLVHFWYRTRRRTGLLGGADRLVDRLLGRLLDGRGDGALVRLTTRVPGGDAVAARGRLLAFAAALDPLLDRHWPSEGGPASGGQALEVPVGNQEKVFRN